MQIICKKKLQFNDYEITINPRNKEKVAKLVRSFIASPSMRPQLVPEWVRQDDMFDLALADGSLVPIGDVPPKLSKPVIDEPTQSVAQPMQPANELSESDLELLNRPVSELIGKPIPAHYPTRPDGFPRPNDGR